MREREYSVPRNQTTKKSHVELDMRLYDASLLRDEVAFEVAISDLESSLARAPSAECIVEQLVAVPNLLECMVSGEYTITAPQCMALEVFCVNSR